MEFKNVTCLTKVITNQTKTTSSSNNICFNDTTVSLNGRDISLDVKDREVVFIASSLREVIYIDDSSKSNVEIKLKWVECFKSEIKSSVLPNEVTDILIITRAIYDELVREGKTDEEIYIEFRRKGLGQMSLDLSIVKDFSALTAYIINEK